MMMFSTGRAAALAAAFCAFTATLAVAGRATAQGNQAGGNWSFTLGAAAMYAPDYEGSNDYEVLPVPIVEVSWRDRIRFTTIGGPGVYATPLATGPFRVDLGVRYDFGREEGDNDALKGLGDLEGGAVAVLRLGYEVGPVGAGLEVARDASGDRDGLVATVEAEYAIDLFAGRAHLSVTPYVTWADDKYMENSFGISAAQSARSTRRLARYDAGSGFKDAGVAVGLGYSITDSVQAMGRLGYSRLLGDAADSPLVKGEGSANQLFGLVGVSYRW